MVVGPWTSVPSGIIITLRLAHDQLSAAATGIIYGLALGYKSCIVPVLALAAVIVVSHQIVATHGVALAALGMLSTLTMGLTVEAYGPVYRRFLSYHFVTCGAI